MRRSGPMRMPTLSSLLGGAVLIALLAAMLVAAAGESRDPAPEQPIAFSHLQHAGDLDMACEYCHTYARRGPVAGMPTLTRCMGCHDLVATDSEEIEKLLDHLDREEPVAWAKVYDLPDHTRFYHDRHIRADVECSSCHGPVETMERLGEWQPIQMGWCIDCHEQRGAPLDCLACHH